MNERTLFEMLYLKYHSTILAKMQVVSLDSSRYSTPAPQLGFISDQQHPAGVLYSYRYFLKDSIEYAVQQFLFDKCNLEQVYAKQRFDDSILYFSNKAVADLFHLHVKQNLGLITEYIAREEDPFIDTGNREKGKKYSIEIKNGMALKKFFLNSFNDYS